MRGKKQVDGDRINMRAGWSVACALGALLASMDSSAQSLDPQVIARPAPGVEVWMVAARGETPANSPSNLVGSGTWQLRDSTGVQMIDAGEVMGLWPEDALLRRVRGMVIWEAPHLLLQRFCTGTAWTCRGTTVFRIRDGKAQRIGYLPGGDSPPIPARDSSGPRFEAVYGKLEHISSSLSHAGSPQLVLILQDDDGRLVLDRAATCSDRINPRPRPVRGTAGGELYFSQLAKAALVDKYCDRAEPLAEIMMTAQRSLRPREYSDLVAGIARVQPFEVPLQ